MKNRFLTSKDYAKLAARAKRILDRELSKPSREWDEALIRECEETMRLCAGKGSAARDSVRAAKLPSFGLRKALIVMLSVLAALALSASVAQAAGIRVWSALLHWDAGYLMVDYPTQSTEVPDYWTEGNNGPVEEEDPERVRFDSAEELRAFLSDMAAPSGEPGEGDARLTPETDGQSATRKRILCPGSEFDGQFEFAQFMGYEYMGVVRIEYLFDGAPLHIDTTYSDAAGDEESFSYTLRIRDDFDSVFDKQICGTNCAFAEGDGESACYFRFGDGFYYISGGVGLDTMEKVVASMLEGS